MKLIQKICSFVILELSSSVCVLANDYSSFVSPNLDQFDLKFTDDGHLIRWMYFLPSGKDCFNIELIGSITPSFELLDKFELCELYVEAPHGEIVHFHDDVVGYDLTNITINSSSVTFDAELQVAQPSVTIKLECIVKIKGNKFQKEECSAISFN